MPGFFSLFLGLLFVHCLHHHSPEGQEEPEEQATATLKEPRDSVCPALWLGFLAHPSHLEAMVLAAWGQASASPGGHQTSEA